MCLCSMLISLPNVLTYTWAFVHINLEAGTSEKQLLMFGLIGGGISLLIHVSLFSFS